MVEAIPIQIPEPTVLDRPASTSGSSDVRALTEAITRGDESAFNTFYHEYSPRIFRLLLVVTGGDEHLSRELHQCVMIRAARKLKVFHTEGELWAWLAQVARNQWRDLLRKRLREARALKTLPPPDHQTHSQKSEHIQGLLNAMPESERQLVERFYFDNLSQKEIARASGRSVKAVQCALARLRARLRRMIDTLNP